MARRDQAATRRGARGRRTASGVPSDAAVLRALKLAREQLLKHAGERSTRLALHEINKVLDAKEPERTFEVTLTAVIEMRADCKDLRLQVAQAFTEYLMNGLHMDANYIAEVIGFKEVL